MSAVACWPPLWGQTINAMTAASAPNAATSSKYHIFTVVLRSAWRYLRAMRNVATRAAATVAPPAMAPGATHYAGRHPQRGGAKSQPRCEDRHSHSQLGAACSHDLPPGTPHPMLQSRADLIPDAQL